MMKKPVMMLAFGVLALMLSAGPTMAVETPQPQKPEKENAVCQQMRKENATSEQLAQRGCCSWHQGICGCAGGRIVCCDNTLSPSCRC